MKIKFIERRLEVARERNVLAPISPEMEELLVGKYIFPSNLKPCPRYEEALTHPTPLDTSIIPENRIRNLSIINEENERDIEEFNSNTYSEEISTDLTIIEDGGFTRITNLHV